MALLTRNGFTSILSRMMDSGGVSEDDIARIRDDFDEREGFLREYGDVSDGDEDYDFVVRTPQNPSEPDPEKYVSRETYDSMVAERDAERQRYKDRFLGREQNPEHLENPNNTPGDANNDDNADTPEEPSLQDILFGAGTLTE